jgi:hypothetical protein
MNSNAVSNDNLKPFPSMRAIYDVFWSAEDQEWVGTCLSYPSLSYLDKDKEAALKGIIDLVLWAEEDIHSS